MALAPEPPPDPATAEPPRPPDPYEEPPEPPEPVPSPVEPQAANKSAAIPNKSAVAAEDESLPFIIASSLCFASRILQE
jgi:hypothetical protein